MNFLGNGLFATIIGVALIAAPMILWLTLYLFSRNSSADLRGVLRWMRTLRLMGGICALLFIVIALFRNIFIPFIGIALVLFSSGLTLPERWLKQRDT
jgi:hypothetical protein